MLFNGHGSRFLVRSPSPGEGIRRTKGIANRARFRFQGDKVIYFAQEDGQGYIKIGFSESVKDRLRALQTGSSVEIHLLIAIPGTREDEGILHERFALERGRGEWFQPSPRLVRFILDTSRRRCAELTVSTLKRDAAIVGVPTSPIWLDLSDWGGPLHADQIGESYLLKCPVCADGFDYLHTTFTFPQELHVRGGTETLTFIGECGHCWSLCLGSHKGQSVVCAVRHEHLDSPDAE